MKQTDKQNKEKKTATSKPVKKSASAALKKETIKKSAAEKAEETRYIEAVGRRKTSVARIRIFTTTDQPGVISVNEKQADKYFFSPELFKTATGSLRKLKLLNKFFVSAKVKGGGAHSQAEAVRHATARALVKLNGEFRKKLKKSGLLKRDPRAKERRKFGLKKARKASQWRKR